ncbi:uncharacterized protein LOC131152882 [Malania oleifera]|uniref:uncharacterized protein LOC131152882 n=1 Tax=Malania oleifera TaxID=397392 RepID=UPI0025ADFC64|nr:uncharacterized protein LOC131152882 [Malania oleifera]
MASPTGMDASDDVKFPAADAEGELNPGRDKNLKVDPVSAQVATSLEVKEKAEMKKEEEKRDAIQTLKTVVIVSGVIAAVAGAAFVITKKLKEK